MPVGNILVGDAGGNIEHDYAGMSVDVVTVSQTAKLFLTGSIPDIEDDLTEVLAHNVSRVPLLSAMFCIPW